MSEEKPKHEPLCMGNWKVWSVTNPEWNGEGKCFVFGENGGPQEMFDHVKALEAKLGEQPEDLQGLFDPHGRDPRLGGFVPPTEGSGVA